MRASKLMRHFIAPPSLDRASLLNGPRVWRKRLGAITMKKK
jgi:hypothetical protein